jgi:hypothetical protein
VIETTASPFIGNIHRAPAGGELRDGVGMHFPGQPLPTLLRSFRFEGSITVRM